jgi:hypothetical protein
MKLKDIAVLTAWLLLVWATMSVASTNPVTALVVLIAGYWLMIAYCQSIITNAIKESKR